VRGDWRFKEASREVEKQWETGKQESRN